jgi:hypothetical protein
MKAHYSEDVYLRETYFEEENLNLFYHYSLDKPYRSRAKTILTVGIILLIHTIFFLFGIIFAAANGETSASIGFILPFIVLFVCSCAMIPLGIHRLKTPLMYTNKRSFNKKEFLIVSLLHEENGKPKEFHIVTTGGEELLLPLNTLSTDIIVFLKKELTNRKDGDININNTIINQKRDRLEVKEMMVDAYHLHSAKILDNKEYAKHKERISKGE